MKLEGLALRFPRATCQGLALDTLHVGVIEPEQALELGEVHALADRHGVLAMHDCVGERVRYLAVAPAW